MGDYIAGACAYVDLQAAIGHAIGAIEDGVSKPRTWVAGASPSANWMQPELKVIDEFIEYWKKNNATGENAPVPDDFCRYDVLNAAVGIWYLSGRRSVDLGDGGISYKTAMYKAMLYNWGPEIGWPRDKAGCKPNPRTGGFRASAYAWTMAFLAWGNRFAEPDIRYTSRYAEYAVPTTIQGTRKWIEQEKRLSPLHGACLGNSELPVPEYPVVHTLRSSPLGGRSQRRMPWERQIVILARRSSQDSHHDYISALAVALHVGKSFRTSVTPMVTADTHFACGCMKPPNGGKGVCVIVLGTEAKRDVENVFPGAIAYPSFALWQDGPSGGYIDSGVSANDLDNFRLARQAAVDAHHAGY